MLFQPTNVIPSTFSGLSNSVIAQADNVFISWQVNGNSFMTGFKIKIKQNNAASTVVYNGSVVNISSSPFAPVDEKGNPQVYTYAPTGTTWASLGITDGNSYKLEITQYWTETTTNDSSVVQYSDSVFISRTKPVLSISISGATGTPPTIKTATAEFTASVSQAQKDSVESVRWVLASKSSSGVRTVLNDTGVVYTTKLKYSYDGLFDDTTYSIKCLITMSSGYTTPDDNSAWVDFNVNYETTYEYFGTFTADCNSAENANLISWSPVEAIPGTASGSYAYATDGISLDSGTTITWDKKVIGSATESYSFASPWVVVLKGKSSVSFGFEKNVSDSTKTMNGYSNPNLCSMSPTGEYFVSGNAVCWLNSSGDISSMSSVSISGTIYSACIINDGETICYNVSGTTHDKIIIASVDTINKTVTIDSETEAPFTSKLISVSSDGKWLVCSALNNQTQEIKLYEISGTTLTEKPIVSTIANVFNPTKFITTTIGELFICNDTVFRVADWEDGIWTSWTLLPNINGEATNATYYRATVSWDGKYLAYADSHYIHFVTFDTVSGDIVYLSYFANPLNSNDDIIQFISDKAIYITNRKFQNSVEENVLCLSPQKTMTGKYYVVKISRYVTYSDNFYYGLQSLGYKNRAYIPRSVSTGETFSFNLFKLDFLPSGTVLSTNQITVQNGNGIISLLGKNIQYNPAMGYYSLVITPEKAVLRQYLTNYGSNTQVDFSTEETLSYTQSPITSIVLGTAAQTAREITVYNGYNSSPSFLQYYYSNYNYVPQFGSDYYSLYFSARFNNDLEGGTGTSDGTGFSLYRTDENGLILTHLATLSASITKLKDFGAKSLVKYNYALFVYDHNGAFMDRVQIENPVCRHYSSFALYETTQDSGDPNVFHVLNVWKFGNNINGGSYSNNNAPQWQQNFTPYPLKQPSAQLYASGTLSALLSNAQGNVYADTAEQMQRLSNISASQNTFFLKDTKGNLFMVAIGAAITQTINTKTPVQEVSVSIPWKEVGDASDVSIISIPTDEGWTD